MNLVQLKIQKDGSLASYIKILRKFDSSLTIGGIRQNIANHDFVIAFDLDHYDVVEELQGIDRKALFMDMIKNLCAAGARVSVYQNGALSSMERLDHRLRTMKEIAQEVEKDIDRETE